MGLKEEGLFLSLCCCCCCAFFFSSLRLFSLVVSEEGEKKREKREKREKKEREQKERKEEKQREKRKKKKNTLTTKTGKKPKKSTHQEEPDRRRARVEQDQDADVLREPRAHAADGEHREAAVHEEDQVGGLLFFFF